eukprot:gene10530-11667_t
MGGVSSITTQDAHGQPLASDAIKEQASFETIVKLVMPKYYREEILSSDDLITAKNSWNTIVNSSAPRFVQQRMTSLAFAQKYPTALDYLSEIFFTRLFDTHPPFVSLLAKVNEHDHRGRFISQMVIFSLYEMTNEKVFEKWLEQFAIIHYRRGVRASDYGIIIDVLLQCFKEVLGLAYTSVVHVAWIRVYSRILRTVVPSAVALEIGTTTTQETPAKTDSFSSFHGSGSKTKEKINKIVEEGEGVLSDRDEPTVTGMPSDVWPASPSASSPALEVVSQSDDGAEASAALPV